jgi:hypothetical protein
VSIGSGAAETYRGLKDTLDQAGWIFIGIFAVSLVMLFVIKQILNRFAHPDDDDAEHTP